MSDSLEPMSNDDGLDHLLDVMDAEATIDRADHDPIEAALQRAMDEQDNTPEDVKVEPADYRSTHKFGHDALAEALWVFSLDGMSYVDEAGSTEDNGWWCARFTFDQPERISLEDGTEPTYVTVPRGSYILRVDFSGFVDATRYGHDAKDFQDDWAAIERDAAPTCLSLPDGSKTACGLMIMPDSKVDANIGFVDCEDCLYAHEQSRYVGYHDHTTDDGSVSWRHANHS